MYFAASLIAAFIITLFLVSKIAKMLNAKRPDIGWVLFALVAGGVLATIAVIALGIFVKGQDPNIMLAITLVSAFLVSTAAYKYINNLNWSGAFTLNIASMAIGLLTMVAAVVLNGKPLNETLNSVNSSLSNISNGELVMSPATEQKDINATADQGEADDLTNNPTNNLEAPIASDVLNSENDMLADDEEPVITELDLLPPSATHEIKKKQQKVYIEPKFRVISIGNIQSAIGYRVRIHRRNGNTITGALKRVSDGDAVVSRYTNKGTVVMPISLAQIHKIEVYK